MAAPLDEGCYGKHLFKHILVRQGQTNDGFGVPRGIELQELHAEAGFETGDSVKRKIGEATGEQLRSRVWTENISFLLVYTIWQNGVPVGYCLVTIYCHTIYGRVHLG